MKKIVSVIFVLIFSLLFTASCGAAEYTASISIEGTAATVTGAPPNSTLIAAFYEGGALTGIEPERGSGTITVDFSDKLPGADRVKVFLWDMENIYPLCPAKEIEGGEIVENTSAPTETTEPENYDTLYIRANGNTIRARLEDNDSAAALVEILKERDVVIDMSDYGGFEKVGSFGFSLPRNDTQITTEPGDIILYSGNQLTIHYGNNSWSYTRLAKVENMTGTELRAALGSGDVTVTLSLK